MDPRIYVRGRPPVLFRAMLGYRTRRVRKKSLKNVGREERTRLHHQERTGFRPESGICNRHSALSSAAKLRSWTMSSGQHASCRPCLAGRYMKDSSRGLTLIKILDRTSKYNNFLHSLSPTRNINIDYPLGLLCRSIEPFYIH